MTARQSATRKKTTAKKTTRKVATKKKATKKKTAKKKTAKKKTAKKKSAKKKTRRISASDLLGEDLPKSLKALSSQLRRDLNAIEKQIESAGKDTRRSLMRVVRDASHHLGALEARGQQEWRKMSSRARNEVERTVKRVRRAAQRK